MPNIHTKSMKINRENATWVFVVAVLVILLGLSIYLGASGWYFSSETNYTTDFQIGKTVQVAVQENEAEAIALNLEGSFLPEEKLPQIIAVKNGSAEKGVFVRAKAKIENEMGENQLWLAQTSNWFYNEEDGYYYYSDLLTSQNKVSLCSYVYTDKSVLFQSSKRYMITIIFETLDENQDVISLWGINPIQSV